MTCPLCNEPVEGRGVHLYCDQAEEWAAMRELEPGVELFPALGVGVTPVIPAVLLRPRNVLDIRYAGRLCLCGGRKRRWSMQCERCRCRARRLRQQRLYNANVRKLTGPARSTHQEAPVPSRGRAAAGEAHLSPED